MQIRLDESAYSKKFHDVIHSWDRYIIAFGSRGSGKTDAFFLKYLISLFEPYYFRLAYVNKEKSNIRDQQYAGFKRVAERVGLTDRLKFYDGDYRVINPKNGNALIPKGVDDPEKTKGLDDVTAIWWDEINKGDKEDFTALNALLRSPQAKYLQFALSFNPVDENHWLRHTFFKEDNAYSLHPDYVGKALLSHSTFSDNEFIDIEAYRETLLINASGNKNRIRVDMDGEWGLTENENPWLYNFDQDKHVKPVNFLPSFPVYISFDFNVDPFSCTIWQMSPQKGINGSFIHCIDEIVAKIKLEDIAQIIKTKYPQSIKYITGDRSGKNEDVGRNQTLYQIMESYLGQGVIMNLNNSNLEHSDSRELCNAMFWHYPRVFIDPSCKNLIADCQKAMVDMDTLKPSQLKKDRGIYKMDTFDSMRYFFQTYFHKFAKETYFRVINKR